MSLGLTDLLITSRPWTTQSPVINDDPYDVTASLGGLYLIHPTAALDMLAQLALAMTAGGVGSAAAFITQVGYVRIEGSATFTIDWTGATVLRDLLGFTGNLSGASAYTAAKRSPLLYIPGKYIATELSPRGTSGMPVLDMSATIGTGGHMTARQEGSPTIVQRFSLRHITKARYRAASAPSVGEWYYTWLNELVELRRFIVLLSVTIGDSTTLSADYSVSTHVGPYFYDLSDSATRRFAFSRDAGFERVEAYYPVSFPAVVTAEYSA